MNLHEIINILFFNYKKILKISCLATLFLFLILLFVYPKSYQSDVSILPPEKESGFGGFSSILSGGDFSSLLSGGMSTATSQLYVEMIKSRTAALYVVDKLKLVKHFNAEDRIDAAEKLLEKLNTDISKEGIVKVNVEVKSTFLPGIFSNSDSLKNLAAIISNTFIEALDSINKEKLASKAKSARIYIEMQIAQTKILLDSAEVALMKFQNANKTISLSDQINAAIEASASLKSEIIQTEIELGLIKSDAGESNRLYNSLNKKLKELQTQYSKFETGNQDYLLAFNKMPTLGKELAGLLREVRIQNEVYVLLQQQYYKEKIQENKDITTVEILDEAISPRKHSKPKTILLSLAGFIFIFLLIYMAFVLRENKMLRTNN